MRKIIEYFKSKSKNLQNQRGMSYVTILISLIIIEFVALSLLAAVSTSIQASTMSNKEIIGYRIAESHMEKLHHEIKETAFTNNYVSPVIYKHPNGFNSSVLVESQTPNLYKVIVVVDYSYGLANGKAEEKKIRIESLVSSP